MKASGVTTGEKREAQTRPGGEFFFFFFFFLVVRNKKKGRGGRRIPPPPGWGPGRLGSCLVLSPVQTSSTLAAGYGRVEQWVRVCLLTMEAGGQIAQGGKVVQVDVTPLLTKLNRRVISQSSL